MKLIEKTSAYYIDRFIYDNGLIKEIYDNKEIYWFKSFKRHREDGAAKENCDGCIDNKCVYYGELNKYKRHFCLNNICFSPKEFAFKTKHNICLICNDFCKQECFI